MNDMPRIFRIIRDLRFKEDPDYWFTLAGYNSSDTYEKIFYVYLVPKDPDSKSIEFEEMVDWLDTNIEEKMNKYDEYQILGHTTKALITLKVCCYGHKPIRTDGKKELKSEFQSPTGLVYKYMFYDMDWDRYGQAKRGGRMFTNGMIDVMNGNRNFKEDLEDGHYGPMTKEEAEAETTFKNYPFYDAK